MGYTLWDIGCGIWGVGQAPSGQHRAAMRPGWAGSILGSLRRAFGAVLAAATLCVVFPFIFGDFGVGSCGGCCRRGRGARGRPAEGLPAQHGSGRSSTAGQSRGELQAAETRKQKQQPQMKPPPPLLVISAIFPDGSCVMKIVILTLNNHRGVPGKSDGSYTNSVS